VKVDVTIKNKEAKHSYLNSTIFQIVGVLLVVLLAVVLLWHSNATSNQAQMAMVAQVYFDGEYRIENGPWKKIVKGKHISSTEGDVTLRGDFHMLAPDGEYVGLYNGDLPIAFYVNHINLTFYEGENEPYVIDIESPIFGDSACGEDWIVHTFLSEST
jgi:hypothetical protein